MRLEIHYYVRDSSSWSSLAAARGARRSVHALALSPTLVSNRRKITLIDEICAFETESAPDA